MLWWSLLSLDQSGVAIAEASNAVNRRQSEAVTVALFVLPLHPYAINPTTISMGILYSPQFRSHQETKMGSRWTLKKIEIYEITEK